MKNYTTIRKILYILSFCLIMTSVNPCAAVHAGTKINFVLLSSYSKTIPIDGEFLLVAVTTNGEMPTFKSSSSSIASVNSYGVVTGKKAGSCKITAKVSGGEASCRVTVAKSTIRISRTELSMENGESVQLSASVSTGHDISWRSSSQSVLEVDDTGLITAKKCGSATITAKADGVSATCKVTVRKPTLSLSHSEIRLYRDQTKRLELKCSNNSEPEWKSSRNSVATVDENGFVTAVSHGSATITVKVDGVSKSCKVTVMQPIITLSKDSLSMRVGDTTRLKATVSSGNTPEWSSSNDTILSVTGDGTIKARQTGKAYVYVKEDGAKASCIVKILNE